MSPLGMIFAPGAYAALGWLPEPPSGAFRMRSFMGYLSMMASSASSGVARVPGSERLKMGWPFMVATTRSSPFSSFTSKCLPNEA